MMQKMSQKQSGPPAPPHSQGEQVFGSSGQSSGHTHESSPAWHCISPQLIDSQAPVF